MAQNNQMGAMIAPPPAAPANPTSVNFQSDPSMRAQFKGFMSGLSAQRSAPMQAPMQSPLPMPAPMQSIDIFQPVQGFANGGGVTFSGGGGYSPGGGVSISSSTVQGDDTFGGRNDRRDLSGLNDPYEAEMIQTGKSFLDALAGEDSYSMDALSRAIANTESANKAEKDRAVADLGVRFDQIQGADIGSGPTRTGAMPDTLDFSRNAVDTVFDIDTTAPDLLALDAFGPSGPNLDFSDPTLAPTNARTVDIATPLSRPNLVPQNIPAMTDAERAQMALDEIGPTGNTIGGVDQVGISVGAPSVGPQFDNLGALGEGAFPTFAPPSDSIVRTEAGSTNRIADSGFGTGEITDAAGSRAPADQSFFGALMDTLTGREYPTDEKIQQGIMDASNRRTNVTLGSAAKDMSALDQLAKRAGQKGSGIFGAITNFGARNAGYMYDDIVNKGYEPIYDRAGQIVATRVPGTNILGRGSVEGRIPGANMGGGGGGGSAPSPAQVIAEEIEKISNPLMATRATPGTPSSPPTVQTSPATSSAPIPGLLRSLGFGYGGYRPVQGISANLNSAADDFLNLLSGTAPRNFAFGGSVSDVDEEEAELSEAITGSYTTSGGGQATGFSYDDGGGDNVQATVADGSFITPSQDDGYKINTTQANQMNEQAKKDAVARDIAMEEQRRAAEAAQRGQALQASIDRLNQMREGVQAPQQSLMSGVADLLGLGSNQNLLSADLSQQGMGTQTMTPNTSVMGYSGPVGQIQTGAANQSIYQTADPSQSGIAGTANVSTQREGPGFSMPSLPSLSQVIDRVIGPTNTYDMSRMTSR